MTDEASVTQMHHISEGLGVRGWSHLDAVLLAALATESPLLLIGPHGTAKSLLVERMAQALKLSLRHYNAALLNYDDLVGIPMPDEDGEHLHFISTPGTIWDANFVFFDEISRCRADLQNKLFPIIHERRVIGIDLENLRHRWAAMNPPVSETLSAQAINEGSYYIGSEPLDAALVDRFPFVVPVPGWGDLSKEDRKALILHSSNGYSPESLEDLPQLVEHCRALIGELESDFGGWVGDYIISLVDLLEQSGLPQSPRRAAMLVRSVIAVHAARLILEGEVADVEESAEVAVLHGIPQSASEVPPARVKILSLHRQAWEMAEYLEDETWRQIMEEIDPVRRVAMADQLGVEDEDLSRLITQAIGTEESDARQIGMAVAMFLAFSKRRNLDPSAYEPLAQLAYHVLEPRMLTLSVHIDSKQNAAWNEISTWINAQSRRKDSFIFRLQRNYLLYGITGLWEKYNWQEALEQFQNDLLLFGVEEEEQK